MSSTYCCALVTLFCYLFTIFRDFEDGDDQNGDEDENDDDLEGFDGEIITQGGWTMMSSEDIPSGNYTCVAENIANLRSSNTAQLTVYGKNTFQYLQFWACVGFKT